MCLVSVTTLMSQCVSAEGPGRDSMEAEDFRALTPYLYRHVNPYGTFRLDMESHLLTTSPITTAALRDEFPGRRTLLLQAETLLPCSS